MAEMQGMLQVTPELEAEGRGGDTEVGTVDVGSIVIPGAIVDIPEAEELKIALNTVFSTANLDFNSFTVTPENTEYSTTDNVIQAHLTNGEVVVPPSVLQVEEFSSDLQQMFSDLEININEFTVGHQDNKINPETGLPEFGFFSKVWRSVKNVVKDVFDGVKDFGKKIGNIAEDVVKSPIGQIAISVAFPQYAPYINAAAKVASGQKLTAADLVSLGVQSYADISGGGIVVDPSVQKAVEATARIADGADIKDVLISSYGSDFAKKLGLDTKVKEAFTDVVGQENVDWLSENIDINQAAADISGGASPFTILNNQFGDKIANYVGSDDPNLTALGYAGIRTAQAIDDGADTKTALYRGAREYYDRGGNIPDMDFGNIADSLNLDVNLPDLGLDITDWMKDVNLDIKDLLPKYNWSGLRDLGIDFNKFDMSGFEFKDFEGMSLPEIQDLGIDLGDIDLKMPKLAIALGGMPKEGETQKPDEEDLMVNNLVNELMPDEGTPFSRQVLERTL